VAVGGLERLRLRAAERAAEVAEATGRDTYLRAVDTRGERQQEAQVRWDALVPRRSLPNSI